VYREILDIIGPEGVILAFGDPDNVGQDRTTFNTVGQGEYEFMWAFDYGFGFAPFDPSEITAIKGILPIVSLNGEDQGAWSLDNDYWTIGNGEKDTELTLVVWIKALRAASVQIFGKYSIYTKNPQREWLLQRDGMGNLAGVLRDESTNAVRKRWQTATPELPEWHMAVFRYSA
jgi:hypothetical protein